LSRRGFPPPPEGNNIIDKKYEWVGGGRPLKDVPQTKRRKNDGISRAKKSTREKE